MMCTSSIWPYSANISLRPKKKIADISGLVHVLSKYNTWSAFLSVYLKILLGARFRDIGHEQLGLRLVLGLLTLSI